MTTAAATAPSSAPVECQLTAAEEARAYDYAAALLPFSPEPDRRVALARGDHYLAAFLARVIAYQAEWDDQARRGGL